MNNRSRKLIVLQKIKKKKFPHICYSNEWTEVE